MTAIVPLPQRRAVGLLAVAALAIGLFARAVPAAGGDDDGALPVAVEPTTTAGAYLAGAFAAAQDDQAAAADFLIRALADDRDNDTLHRRAFIASLGGGLIEESVALADGVLDTTPNESELAGLVLVVDDLAERRYGAAVDRLGALDRTGIARFALPMVEAWALAGSGAVDEALTVLEPLTREDGFEAMADLHRALILDVAGAAGAAAAYDAALAHGDGSRAIQAAGNYFERHGEPDKARSLYLRFLDIDPDSLILEPALKRLNAGEVPAPMFADARDGAAEVLFQIATVVSRDIAVETGLIYTHFALYLRPDFPAATLLLGDILADRGHDAEALAAYRTVAENGSVGWQARLRAALMLARLEDSEAAIALLDAMTAERPNRAGPLVQQGDVHRFEADFPAAVEAYDRAFDADPEGLGADWSFFYKRGMALERAQDHDRAIADLERAIALNDQHAHLLNYLGYLWIDLGVNLAEGEALVRQALELRPNDGYIIDSLGWAQYRQGQFDAAVETLERAVLFRPLDPVINDHLGDAYWQVGRLNEARFQWSHALAGAEEPEMIALIEAKLAHGLVADGEAPATTAGIGEPGEEPTVNLP